MTVKVCKQKFEGRLIITLKGLWGAIQILLFLGLIVSSNGFFTEYEECKVIHNQVQFFKCTNNQFSFFISVGLNIIILALPVFQVDNIYMKINRKLGLFEWNRDC